MYLNRSKLTQSAAGPTALKPAANGRYLMCKSLPYYLHLLYRTVLLSVKCMLGLFVVSVIHRTLIWATGSLTCVRDHSIPCTRGSGTPTASQHNIFDSEKLTFFSLCPSRVLSPVPLAPLLVRLVFSDFFSVNICLPFYVPLQCRLNWDIVIINSNQQWLEMFTTPLYCYLLVQWVHFRRHCSPA